MTEEMFRKMAQSIIDGDSDAATALASESIAATLRPSGKSTPRCRYLP